MTDQRRAEDSRREFERRWAEARNLDALGTLAHEFNDLLTVMLGNASLASIQLGAGSLADAGPARVEEAAQRSAQFCQQLLAFAGRGVVVTEWDLNTATEGSRPLLIAVVGCAALVLVLFPRPSRGRVRAGA